jgi:hypothetical protein
LAREWTRKYAMWFRSAIIVSPNQQIHTHPAPPRLLLLIAFKKQKNRKENHTHKSFMLICQLNI